jgi:CRISPR-associated endonuclease/helicase Cas3
MYDFVHRPGSAAVPDGATTMAFAHSANSSGQRHSLVEHLRGVAEQTAAFAANLGAEELGRYLGLWHDLGKFHPGFQQYLLACEAEPTAHRRGPDHKAAGALLAQNHSGLPALLIQGHHGGLREPAEFNGWLDERDKAGAAHEALALARQVMADLEPSQQLSFPAQVENDSLAAELFLRLLFSCLVDADYLDTERHFRRELSEQRTESVVTHDLWDCFERNQAALTGQSQDTLGQARHAIYEACLDAAEQPPGLFRFTVPTGGGKTRSAMAFALRHALAHGLHRIIVAVPFISITEQTAEVYRHIFDERGVEPVVLEHHSAVAEALDEGDLFQPASVWARLAAENWDAPIIVTTTVRLFESLFANTPSRCRRLHRLARSVIILDEAQALPPQLLTPALDALRELCFHYGSTVVLSTATQPAFETIPTFAALPATAIVADPAPFFRQLQRVRYEWRTDRLLAWPEVAQLLQGEHQGLAVVNTKKDALALLDALADPDVFHLSTLLCGAHRRRVIQELAARLPAGQPCRLVATQVVEAGVDLDFPLVLRALGPLDGIIQAAGRCNREGHLPYGRAVIFEPADGGLPTGPYRTATNITQALLGRGDLDPDDPAVPSAYFRQLFESVSTDRDGIQALRQRFEYPEVARRFRMIEEDTDAVVITTYGSDEEQRRVRSLVEQLRHDASAARLILRRLQPYVVSLRRREVERFRRQGYITPVLDGLGEWLGRYDPMRGLVAEDLSPDELVV